MVPPPLDLASLLIGACLAVVAMTGGLWVWWHFGGDPKAQDGVKELVLKNRKRRA